MRLIALAMAKMEGDIIEEFVRHTLRFVDHVIVVDCASLDSAPKILRSLQTEGLPLTVWEGERIPTNPDRRMEFARRALEGSEADYLLLLDVDEFVKTPSRRILEAALASLSHGAHAVIPWTTYVPAVGDDSTERRVLARMRHRLCREAHPYRKVVLSSSLLDQRDAVLSPGNHGIADPGGKSVMLDLAGVELAHFPVRTLRQIQYKALLGWPCFLAMGYTERNGLASHWRRLNEELLNRPHWNDEDFLRFAWHYLDEGNEVPEIVLDPLEPMTCRYQCDEMPELLTVAIAFTHQLAHAYASATKAGLL